jgi:hypothetical protein
MDDSFLAHSLADLKWCPVDKSQNILHSFLQEQDKSRGGERTEISCFSSHFTKVIRVLISEVFTSVKINIRLPKHTASHLRRPYYVMALSFYRFIVPSNSRNTYLHFADRDLENNWQLSSLLRYNKFSFSFTEFYVTNRKLDFQKTDTHILVFHVLTGWDRKQTRSFFSCFSVAHWHATFVSPRRLTVVLSWLELDVSVVAAFRIGQDAVIWIIRSAFRPYG